MVRTAAAGISAVVPAAISFEDVSLLSCEPISVVLANTLYVVDERKTIDLLRDAVLRRLWLTSERPAQIGLPRDLAGDALDEVVRLRDAVYDLLRAAASDGVPGRGSVDVVNDAIRRSPLTVRLTWSVSEPSAVSEPVGGARLDRVLSSIAVEAITTVTGPEEVRECAGPGCRLLFVATHGRRRFCHPSCSHRSRQAAYVRRASPDRGSRTHE
jgi:predicted RNA-binding Zn ribbon-like protein